MSLLGASFGGSKLWQKVNRAPAFAGRELELNSAASLANPVPFRVKVAGQLGKRLDSERSDRDFFRIDVRQSAPVLALGLKSLPNLTTCVALCHSGNESPVGRYCAGAAGRDLNISALRVEPGRYLFAVLQDRDEYTGEPAPPVFENISDDYELSVEPAVVSDDSEVELNDVPALASTIGVGKILRGRLPWMRDPDHGVPMRLHRLGSGVKPSPTDAVGQYRAAPISLAPGQPACLSLSLVPNPWAPGEQPLVAPAGDEQYSVRAEATE